MATRNRLLITSFVIPVAFLILRFIELPFGFWEDYSGLITFVFMGILMMALVSWVVDFNLKGERIFTVIAFPVISLLIVIDFLQLIISTTSSPLDRISTTLGFAIILGVLTYVLISTINILNLAAIKKIPLGQAARAAHYVLTMVFSYFAFVIIVNLEIFVLFKFILAFLLVFTYTFVALWTISLEYGQRVISSLSIALLLLFLFIILSIWPINSFYFALILTLVFYMNLGIALEVRETISRSIWIEYFIIFTAVIVILFSVASWGINGTIF